MTAKVVIGITGNIGTGKSIVLRMLQELGASTIDADKLVHQVMKQGTPVYKAIVQEFGKFILNEDGEINRDRLGKIAFAIPEAMARLESFTHPVVRQVILHRIEKATAPVVAIEAIKLFESGLAQHCQATWVVTASPEVQLKRLVERRKMSPKVARQRMKAQSFSAEKESKADTVIDNSGELMKTWNAVKNSYTALLKKKSPKEAPPKEETPKSAPAAAKPDQTAPTAKEINKDDLVIRRAKRPDLESMAEVISIGTNGSLQPGVSEMMENLFSRAYILALAGDHVVGVAGWQTENLIAGLQDFYVVRDDLWSVVGTKMLDMVHKEIESLSCEVSLIFVKEEAGQEPVKFFEAHDYEQTVKEKLGFMWKDAAEEWQPEKSVLLYKKLREQRIMVPM